MRSPVDNPSQSGEFVSAHQCIKLHVDIGEPLTAPDQNSWFPAQLEQSSFQAAAVGDSNRLDL